MKKISFFVLSLIGTSIFYFGCKKENNTNSGFAFAINATSYSKWVYFSFDKNDTVQITDPKNSTGWDLAFQRFNIKSNSGLSGKGIGGVFNSGKTGSTGFSQLVAVPDTATFTVDDSLFIPGAYGVIDTVIANPVLSNWYNYDQTTNVLSSMNLIYVVKTATGKYAKLQVISYYNATDPSLVTGSGYVKFNYFYQQNGSKNLQ